ncbi:Stage V sporulation protein T [compost metagenome]
MENLKATGIIRRVDDLGRVVIPKEIRRSLRIKEGDALEIFVRNNEVVYRKYNRLSHFSDIADSYMSTLGEETGHVCLVVDDCSVVATSDKHKKYYDKTIGLFLDDVMKSKSLFFNFKPETYKMFTDPRGDDEYLHCNTIVVAPIKDEFEVHGAVIMLSLEGDKPLSEFDKVLTKMAGDFLSKQLGDPS